MKRLSLLYKIILTNFAVACLFVTVDTFAAGAGGTAGGGVRVLDSHIYPTSLSPALQLIGGVLPTPHNELGLDQDVAYANDLKQYWFYSTLHYYRFTEYGTYGARVNYAHRYGVNGVQYQLEAYPVFNWGSATLLLAYANHTQILYPQWQYIVEPYFTLPRAFEVSIGMRYLDFLGTHIYTYTGSIGKYIGDYFVWFRPYHYAPTAENYFEVGIRRYYCENRNYYIGFRMGAGRYPDIGDLPPLDDIIKMRAFSAGLGAQFPLSSTLYARIGIGYVRQVFPSGHLRQVTDGSIGLAWQF